MKWIKLLFCKRPDPMSERTMVMPPRPPPLPPDEPIETVLKVGDVVRMKSGGQKMVVSAIRPIKHLRYGPGWSKETVEWGGVFLRWHNGEKIVVENLKTTTPDIFLKKVR